MLAIFSRFAIFFETWFRYIPSVPVQSLQILFIIDPDHVHFSTLMVDSWDKERFA